MNPRLPQCEFGALRPSYRRYRTVCVKRESITSPATLCGARTNGPRSATSWTHEDAAGATTSSVENRLVMEQNGELVAPASQLVTNRRARSPLQDCTADHVRVAGLRHRGEGRRPPAPPAGPAPQSWALGRRSVGRTAGRSRKAPQQVLTHSKGRTLHRLRTRRNERATWLPGAERADRGRSHRGGMRC